MSNAVHGFDPLEENGANMFPVNFYPRTSFNAYQVNGIDEDSIECKSYEAGDNITIPTELITNPFDQNTYRSSIALGAPSSDNNQENAVRLMEHGPIAREDNLIVSTRPGVLERHEGVESQAEELEGMTDNINTSSNHVLSVNEDLRTQEVSGQGQNRTEYETEQEPGSLAANQSESTLAANNQAIAELVRPQNNDLIATESDARREIAVEITYQQQSQMFHVLSDDTMGNIQHRVGRTVHNLLGNNHAEYHLLDMTPNMSREDLIATSQDYMNEIIGFDRVFMVSLASYLVYARF